MSFLKKRWAIHSRISLTFHTSRKNKSAAYDLWQKKGSFRNSPTGFGKSLIFPMFLRFTKEKNDGPGYK